MRPYRMLDHTADLGVEVFGTSPQSLFENAAHALFDLIVERSGVKPKTEERMTVTGEDWADLMFNWLRELLYVWHGSTRLVAGVAVSTVTENRLEAGWRGEAYNPRRHTLRHDIKAVTYHQLQVEHRDGEWSCRVIFDV